MDETVRSFACGIAFAMSLAAGNAQADSYPERPIRVIVPLAPGGGSDYTARFIGQRLSDRVGQPVVVDNRPGASGILGTDLVAKANPDGYTLLLAYSTHAQSARLFKSLPYDPIKDFAPVTEVIATPLGMLIHPSIPAKTVKEFIAYAKANSGKLNYGSSGPGSSPHLTTELLASMAGFKMTHIPYKGVAQYITAQLGNEVQFTFSNMFTTMPHWKSGRLRILGHTGTKRLEAMPDIPTVSEAGVPGFESLTWYGYLAPAKTPQVVIDTLQKHIAAIVHLPEVRKTLVEQGNEPVVNTPDEFGQVMRADAEKWGEIGKKLGVVLE